MQPVQWFGQSWESGVPARPGPRAVGADGAQPACVQQGGADLATRKLSAALGVRPLFRDKDHPCTETNLSLPQATIGQSIPEAVPV